MNKRRYVYTWSTMCGMQRANQYNLLCSISIMEETEQRAEVRSESDAADGYRVTKTQLYSDALPHRFDICLTTLSLAGTRAMTSAGGTKRNTREEHERNGCGNARCVLTKRRRMTVVRVGSATIHPSKERIRTRGARQRYSDGARATCCHRCEEAPAASVIHRGVGTYSVPCTKNG